MWNSLVNITSAVTGAFYSTEQPPYDCAVPHKDVGDLSNIEDIANEHKRQFTQLYNDPLWTLVSFTDPDGGDLHLFTRPSIGRYQFLRATFSLSGVTAEKFIQVVGSSELSVRQSFSAECVELESLAKPLPNIELIRATYWAPPPVASRDFCFLVKHSENIDQSWDLHGCSVSSDLAPEKGGMTVRGASLWGWHLTPVGDSLFVSYSACFDPRGWTPPFLIAWLKTTASKEFCAIRARLLGKDVKVELVGLEASGVSQEELTREVEEHNREEQQQQPSK